MKATAPTGFLPSRGKNPKYKPPDMSQPIKIRDFVIPVKVVNGQRIIDGDTIAKAIADDTLTAQDLFALILEERLMWDDVRIEVDGVGDN